MSDGYSGKALWEKLGLKPGTSVRIVAVSTLPMPDYISELPFSVNVLVDSASFGPGLVFVHIFADDPIELSKVIARELRSLEPSGSIWVSWPKKSSGLRSELGENEIREVAFPFGLVDVKVCSVDRVWSALKLVLRTDQRTSIRHVSV